MFLKCIHSQARWLLGILGILNVTFLHNFCIKPYYPKNLDGTRVIVGSMNMGYDICCTLLLPKVFIRKTTKFC